MHCTSFYIFISLKLRGEKQAVNQVPKKCQSPLWLSHLITAPKTESQGCTGGYKSHAFWFFKSNSVWSLLLNKSCSIYSLCIPLHLAYRLWLFLFYIYTRCVNLKSQIFWWRWRHFDQGCNGRYTDVYTVYLQDFLKKFCLAYTVWICFLPLQQYRNRKR